MTIEKLLDRVRVDGLDYTRRIAEKAVGGHMYQDQDRKPYPLESIRIWSKDESAGGFNIHVVRDLLDYYDDLHEKYKALEKRVEEMETEIRNGEPL